MTPLLGISSMAPRLVLAELAQAYAARSGCPVRFASGGGVDVAQRVRSGECFDVVVLASDAIEQLMASGHVMPGGRVDLLCSGVAVAVRAGQAHPDLSTEASVRAAVLAADRVGYSTGPSGRALTDLFARWGIAERMTGRLVCAAPGEPVASLVADGRVALGFQQRSELIHADGIEVVGDLPPAIQIVTTFSAGICAGTAQAAAVRDMLAFMNSPDAVAAKQRQGMGPATPGIAHSRSQTL